MTTQLTFDHNYHTDEIVAYYNGDEDSALYRVRVERDDSPANPFEDDDGLWPTIADYQDRGHRFTVYDKAPGAGIESPLDRFSGGQIVRHQKAILAALGDTASDGWGRSWSIETDLAEWLRDNWRVASESKADALREYFGNALGDVSDGDKLETLAALYGVLKIPAAVLSSRGHCQGDYAELLIVATPEAQAAFGWKSGSRTPEQIRADMEAQRDLYSAWAWGDVYGYIVEKRCADDPDEWEDVDSCWGYYGSDFGKSGLAEAALGVIEYEAAQDKARRTAKLKELIRANAPLSARQAVLSAYRLED